MSGRNHRVPLVNSAKRAAIFERQSGGHNRGALTLTPDEIYCDRGVDLTYETLVLRNSSFEFTNHVISMDDLKDDRYEKFEVTYDSDHDFRLEKHPRKHPRTGPQKPATFNLLRPATWNFFKPHPTDGTLPARSNNDGHE